MKFCEILCYKDLIIPILSLNCVTFSFSATSSLVSLILQKTGSGKNQRILDVKPFALFLASSIIGRAVCG